MFEVIVENKRGNKLNLRQNENYTITSITGLGPPNATINTVNVGGFDGEKFNSSKAEKRNIVMTLKILGDIETNRIALYKIFKTKEWVKFHYKNGLRDVYIEGYIESAPIELFTQNQEMQISIICPSPYFNNAEEIIEDMNLIISMFYFPFAIGDEGQTISKYEEILEKTIINEGDVEEGIVIEFRAIGGEVVNPKIFNRNTTEFFGLNITMQEGDLISITTVKGSKTVTLLRNGENINIFNNIMKNITWLQLEPGDNVFTYEAETGAEFLNVLFRHIDLFEGV